MSQTCSRCGTPVPEGEGACPVCGTIVGESATRTVTEVRRCQNCGSTILEEGRYCGRCGFLTDQPYSCRSCHAPVGLEERYCTHCGTLVRPEKLNRSTSRPLAALMLALIPGLFSIWGLGQFFSASFYKGAVFAVLGLALLLVAPLSLIITFSGLGDLAALSVLGAVLWCALWVLQAMDAYWEAGGE